MSANIEPHEIWVQKFENLSPGEKRDAIDCIIESLGDELKQQKSLYDNFCALRDKCSQEGASK